MTRPTLRRALSSAMLLLGVLTLVGCDALGGGDETAILNADSAEPPEVEYTFQYSPEDRNGGTVEVASEGSGSLTEILQSNGFSRDDIVSARVESVVLDGLSTDPAAKIYSHVRTAELYLGTGASGVRIARGTVDSQTGTVTLDPTSNDVTSTLKAGPSGTFLRLDTDDFEGQYTAQATVTYRIEVSL